MAGKVETLPSPCRVASGVAAGCQRIDVSSLKAVPSLGPRASVGRSAAYWECPVGASTLIESMPPSKKTETRMRPLVAA